jgi:hypothetical protein
MLGFLGTACLLVMAIYLSLAQQMAVVNNSMGGKCDRIAFFGSFFGILEIPKIILDLVLHKQLDTDKLVTCERQVSTQTTPLAP